MIKKRLKILLLLILVGMFYLILFNQLANYRKYNKAVDLVKNNEYDDAIELLEELQSYNDSVDLIKEAKYENGKTLYNNKKYDVALEIFKDIDYKDSKELADKCDIMITFTNARQLYKNGEYRSALDIFNTIDNEDSRTYAKWCEKELGKQELSLGNYKEGVILLKGKLDDPRIKNEIATHAKQNVEIFYDIAMEYYNDGDFSICNVIFDSLGDYLDSNNYKNISILLENMQGEWYNENKDKAYIEISGWNIKMDGVFFDNFKLSNTLIYKPTTVSSGNIFERFATDDGLIFESSKTNTRQFISVEHYKNGFEFIILDRKDFLDVKAIEQKNIDEERRLAIEKLNSRPSIGMTTSEVENTGWGKPKKINKTTTKYGVSEQWVYSQSRYVYFEDGIVTVIQE